MNRRPTDAEARFDELMRRRSGSDRVEMMSEMFDFARALVLSSLRARYPDATEAELRVRLFERLYREDIDPADQARVVARLRADR